MVTELPVVFFTGLIIYAGKAVHCHSQTCLPWSTPACHTHWHRAAPGCGLRTSVGKPAGTAHSVLLPGCARKEHWRLLSGGHILADLTVAISGMVGMDKSVVTPAVLLGSLPVPEGSRSRQPHYEGIFSQLCSLSHPVPSLVGESQLCPHRLKRTPSFLVCKAETAAGHQELL